MESNKQVETVPEIRGYHQPQVYPCVFYINNSVILTYVYDCVIVSYKLVKTT